MCQRCCRSDFNSVCTRSPCCFSKVLEKQHLIDIYLTTVFGVWNFENTSAMRVIFCLKLLKILSAFQKCRKTLEKAFCFLDNCLWIGWVYLFLLRTKSLWPAVNVFTNSRKILHITNRDFFEVNFLHSDQQTW